MEKSEEKYVSSGPLRLWTESFGYQQDPTVLLVMGSAAQGIGWPDDMVEVLVAAGRHVIRFDHRDTGLSDWVDFTTHPYTLADMAADAEAVLDGYGIDRAHIAGASLGGGIAQWLGAHRPQRVLTLTLIMTSPMGNEAGPAWARAVAGLDPDPGELPPPDAALIRHFMSGGHEEGADETWRLLNGEAVPYDGAAARRFVEASLKRARKPGSEAQHDLAGRSMTEDRRAPLSSIAAPTLVVHGAQDPLFPPRHGQALAEAIPGAELAVVDGMGHAFFSPGLPRRIADLMVGHTQGR
ncbi:Pimeloyl-ACP methyl ester carboxylesterase [Sinosporangium album]|uniref:Pimeloyl-ACP methyl ester carboxylesterase n=1 Tax=Sinosporangium album TaxID=504805 RepID=A0A1G8LK38_9ACTN|nr:alpha/beta fold hydrolase [Sinosporangium album]SDI55600.1 Pimeloyl-ACP methyl ester carboxylesterase [Sinosporangium album]